MSPDHRTLGPLAREAVKKAGMVASLALVLAAGLANPAIAAPPNPTDPETTATVPTDDKCRPGNNNDTHYGVTPSNRDTGDCKGSRGEKGEKDRPAACYEIDAYQGQDEYEVRGAVSNGNTYAGIRDLRPSRNSVDDELRWTDLSELSGYPTTSSEGVPCGVSVNEHTNGNNGNFTRRVEDVTDVKIDIITTTGRVFEIICEVSHGGDELATITCPHPDLPRSEDAWKELNQPEPDADNDE
ncbi:hypothetical protein [Streptomyces tailanensis]|uniref:hypothetical protein n=1 Tax=Streptomyces tailanensis TaxID=2569858 RepID=UPI00122E9C2F|nr:hypothetical protein [Streptomyces tailanensis]